METKQSYVGALGPFVKYSASSNGLKLPVFREERDAGALQTPHWFIPAPLALLEMFFLSILGFLLFLFWNAFWSHPRTYMITSTSALGPMSELHIANTIVAPDGYSRPAVIVNGAFPAPLIQAQKDDQFAVRVFNELTDNTMPLQTSIHWHGISQPKSNWADGVPFVTQYPVCRGATFEQRFNTTGQTGTYWYHSHYTTQYCDGLRGPLVIYDSNDPLAHLYDIDNENTVITLSDWYHIPSVRLGKILTEITENSTLINGRGRYPGGPPVPLSVVSVRQGLRYRFRIVSASCLPSYNFTIDGHRMTIIEADGIEVEPVEVDSLRIHAGQRYSVVVTANKNVGNYWIRALSSLTNASFDGGQNMAILRYTGAPHEEPMTSAGPYELAFDEGDLHPLINPGAPGIPEIGKADVNIQLASGFTDGYYEFNNVSYVDPPVPVLLQILSGARHPSELLPNGSVYELPLNKTIEISFPHPNDAPAGPHPIHMHGHTFDVVRVAGSNSTNFVNPIRRDVVSIGNDTTDNVTIRFVTDNPGPWILHCHIDWHLHHGMAVVMAEATRETAQQQGPIVPKEWSHLCSVPSEEIN